MPKILLVEDNEMSRDMLSRRLMRWGYEVITAVNGAEVMAKTHQETPDLILMDMSLPIKDGWTTTRELKADPHSRNIPIIAQTAHTMPEDRQKCLMAGCNEYVPKPIDFQSLVGKIEALLRRR